MRTILFLVLSAVVASSANAELQRATFELPISIGVKAFGSPTSIPIDGTMTIDVYRKETAYDARLVIEGVGLGLSVSAETKVSGQHRSSPIQSPEATVMGQFGGQQEVNVHFLRPLRQNRILLDSPEEVSFVKGDLYGLQAALFQSQLFVKGSPIVSYVTETDPVERRTIATYAVPEGDFDGDDIVGFSDFLTLSQNFNRADMSYFDGDMDRDGAVTFADFLFFSPNFGEKAAKPLASVPEPSFAQWLLWLMIFDISRKRIRRRPRVPVK